jgi:trafficking protein particle complex subunit 8
MALCLGGSTDVFDIARSPFAEFHYQEKCKQVKLAKVSLF